MENSIGQKGFKYVFVLTDYYSPDMKAVKIDQEVLGELVKLVTSVNQ